MSFYFYFILFYFIFLFFFFFFFFFRKAVFPSGKEPFQIMYKELKASIDFINNFKYQDKTLFTFKTVLPPIDKVNCYDLNAIHSEFEKFLTQLTLTSTGGQNNKQGHIGVELPELEKVLNRVNARVHSMEHLLYRPDGDSSSWFTVSLYSTFRDESKRRVPLRESDYQKFTLGCEWGDLLLGYGTTGKSLWHIYKGDFFFFINNIIIIYLLIVDITIFINFKS